MGSSNATPAASATQALRVLASASRLDDAAWKRLGDPQFSGLPISGL